MLSDWANVKRFKQSFWGFLAGLVGLWLLADLWVVMPSTFSTWRNTWINFTGIMGLGVMSLALMLAFFRATPLDFWGVTLCVAMMSVSGLFYIIGGQFLISKLWRLVPISGYGGRLEAWKFLILPVLIGVVSGIWPYTTTTGWGGICGTLQGGNIVNGSVRLSYMAIGW